MRELESNINTIWIENLKDIHEEVVSRVIETEGMLNYNDALLSKFVNDRRAKLITLDNNLKKFINPPAKGG